MLPEEIRFKTNTLLKAALSPPGALFIVVAIVLMFQRWTFDNAAAWVQAIGSIGAIIGAFMVATRTHELERRKSREADLGVEIRAVSLAEGIVQEAVSALTTICSDFYRPGETPSGLKRLESVHQALMIAISQPVSEQALKPTLKALQSVSHSCGILQDALSHAGTLRTQDRETLRRHLDGMKAHRDILKEILGDIRARMKRNQ